MSENLEAVQDNLQEAARKARKRAEEARMPALREFYEGRADGLQSAADTLGRFTYDPSENPFRKDQESTVR